jgi:hypothetical protein
MRAAALYRTCDVLLEIAQMQAFPGRKSEQIEQITAIACMSGSSEPWGLNSSHIHGAHVPVEEPSTASKADTDGAAQTPARLN